MTDATQKILDEIRRDTRLENIKKFNTTIKFINDNFRTYEIIENKHSSCITIRGVLTNFAKSPYVSCFQHDCKGQDETHTGDCPQSSE